jgi:Na+/citrate or Na+/malate symporter
LVNRAIAVVTNLELQVLFLAFPFAGVVIDNLLGFQHEILIAAIKSLFAIVRKSMPKIAIG